IKSSEDKEIKRQFIIADEITNGLVDLQIQIENNRYISKLINMQEVIDKLSEVLDSEIINIQVPDNL
ncbi:3504_t:CDS:1, partial [Dentiscutata erythropus]